MELKIKKLSEDAVMPSYAKPGDAGMDLTATKVTALGDGQMKYEIGLAFEIPQGYVGLIFPRSSVCKVGLSLTNAVGVIDSGYRGPISFVFNMVESNRDFYEIGDRIGQLVIMKLPEVTITEVDKLSESERGVGGFGSTGK